jgi:hypothetical protein
VIIAAGVLLRVVQQQEHIESRRVARLLGEQLKGPCNRIDRLLRRDRNTDRQRALRRHLAHVHGKLLDGESLSALMPITVSLRCFKGKLRRFKFWYP